MIKQVSRFIAVLSLLCACSGGGSTDVKSATGGPKSNGKTVSLGGTAAGGATGSNVAAAREVDKKAVKYFDEAVESYTAAKSKGNLKDKCSGIADEFADSYKRDKALVEGLFNAGAVLLECGQTAAAEPYFDQVISLKPSDEKLKAGDPYPIAIYARAAASKGYLKLLQNDLDEAKRLYDDAVKTEASFGSFEGSLQARINLAGMSIEEVFSQPKERRSPEAIQGIVQELRRALAIDASSIQAYATYATLYYRLGYDNLASLVCKLAFEVSKDYAPIYHILGLVSIKQNKVTTALQQFKDALSKDPDYIPALMNVGAITIRFRDYKTAEEKFSRVVALEPNNFDAWVSLGVAQRGLEQYDKAEESYLKAQKLRAEDPSTYLNLAILYQDNPVQKPEFTADPAKKFEKAKEYMVAFKNRSEGKGSWTEYQKEADKRIKQCDDLIRVTRSVPAATPQ